MVIEEGTAAARAEKIAELESIRDLEVDPEQGKTRIGELLGDVDEDVRGEAAAAVWSYPDAPKLVERVLDLAKKDASATVRAKAITALGRVVYEGDLGGAGEPGYEPEPALGEPTLDLWTRARDHLLAVVKDEKKTLEERRFALEGLGFLGSDDRVRELIREFHGRPERAAKLSAVFAMGRSGDDRWSEEIMAALDATDTELRVQAIWAAGEAEVGDAVDKLVKVAKDGKSAERMAAVESLGRIGGKPAGESLLRSAERDPDPEVRQAATIALEELAMGHGADGEEPGDDGGEDE
jgi:HEAT repeat protein